MLLLLLLLLLLPPPVILAACAATAAAASAAAPAHVSATVAAVAAPPRPPRPPQPPLLLMDAGLGVSDYYHVHEFAARRGAVHWHALQVRRRSLPAARRPWRPLRRLAARR